MTYIFNVEDSRFYVDDDMELKHVFDPCITNQTRHVWLWAPKTNALSTFLVAQAENVLATRVKMLFPNVETMSYEDTICFCKNTHSPGCIMPYMKKTIKWTSKDPKSASIVVKQHKRGMD